MPIAVLSEYTEKEYEPFDSYSRYCPAMPVSVCFFDTALCTLGKIPGACFSILSDRKNGMMASLIPVKSALQNL